MQTVLLLKVGPFQLLVGNHRTLTFSSTFSGSIQTSANTKVQYNGYMQFLTVIDLPIFIEISPMAQVALLHTEINSGLRFEPRIGIKSPEIHKKHPCQQQVICIKGNFCRTSFNIYFQSWNQRSPPKRFSSGSVILPMHGFTCWKHALVKSPRSAKLLCRTSGIGSCKTLVVLLNEHTWKIHMVDCWFKSYMT